MNKFLVAAMVLFAVIAFFLLTTDYLAWGKGAAARGEHERAYGYFVKAANQGNAEAQFYLGDMFHHGKGVKQDYAKAIEYYRMASEKSQPEAMYGLGQLYFTGKGIARDQREGARLYLLAAKAGQINAQFEMGVIFAEGKAGFERDYKQSVDWYMQAAQMGHGDAQFNLASMYQFGQGVNSDQVEAYIWYSLAANYGRTDAIQIRDYVVAKRLNPDQTGKVHTMAKERLDKIEANRSARGR